MTAGHVMPSDACLPNECSSSVNALNPTDLIILPRNVTRLHHVHQAPEEHICSDLAAWEVEFVIQKLHKFVRVSSAKTLLAAQYRMLPDKVQLLWRHLEGCRHCLLSVLTSLTGI